jgi:hypothetical protein
VLPPMAEVFDHTSDTPPPAQRTLNLVNHHRRWISVNLTCHATDAALDGQCASSRPTCRNREATRRVAVSQPGADSCLVMQPDGTAATAIPSLEFEIILQRRGGLHISAAKLAFDTLEAAGERVDRLGDGLANAGEYNRRHNATLRAVHTMVEAVSVGQCVLGDKEDVAKTAAQNAGHAVDLAELGGDDATGGDCNYELKVVSPTIASYSAGNGSAANGGAPASVGHLYAFGSTEEKYHRLILGCAESGRQLDGAFDHATGRGWVAEHRGHYYDAIHVKRIKTVPFIVENYGGIAPRGLRQCKLLARRAKGPNAVDRTRYGDTRVSTRSFFVHHTSAISKTAVHQDAQNIWAQIVCQKQRAQGVRTAAYAAAGAARA